MRPRLFSLFVVCLMCLFSARAATAQTVNEAESSVVLNETTVDVLIVLENPNKSFDDRIELELLDAESAIRAQAAQSIRVKNGKEAYKISMPVGDLIKAATGEIAFYRLQYRVGGKTGIVSLSELVRDVFELRAAASENVLAGTNYRVRVRAVQPFTKQAVKNVKIESELELNLDTEADEDKLKLKSKAETNAEGFAVLDFKIPGDVKLDYDGDLKITGRKNGIVREIDEDLEADENEGSVFLTTDKPIYQPGQSFNVRGLYFDADKTVVSGSDLEFKIYDQDDALLYRETAKTSAFGVASVAWKIPENAKLGDYRVEIEADGDLALNSINFKVSRYELPNFTVNVKPDKTFYLPTNKQAEITVSADYLFGKPVTRGKVRLVRESERRWNYKEQKYDVEEKQALEGATDEQGKFVAKVDLSEEFADLAESGWQRYRDLRFAAYFTDLTTNKTEQRRFDIRLTKEAIHVYLTGRSVNQNPNLPVTLYVSAFYADGSPAVCEVSVKGKYENESNVENLAALKTNSLGAGKLEFKLPRQKSDYGLQIKITARDKNGQSGGFEEEIDLEEDESLKIETDKTIYKPGESVKIKLVSTEENALVYVDVARRRTLLESFFVRLENGKGELKISYNPNFKGELTIGAYSDETESYYDAKMQASRGVIFPERQNLKLDAQFSGDTFKPNEETKVKFSVLDGANGKAAESALGVVVFDKAIEERARADAEFGGYFSRFSGLLGYSKSFGRISLKDLNDLNLSKPISPELQLAAEIMLAENYYFPRIYRSRENEAEAKSVYAKFFERQILPVENALKSQYAKNYAHPTDEASLRKILSESGLNFDNLLDPWRQSYRAVFTVEKSRNVFALQSAGTDKKFGTADDFNVLSLGFDYFLPLGKTIDKANLEYYQKTSGFIRNYETLRDELKRQNFDSNALRDRWNKPYRIEFGVNQRKFTIVFRSNGANGNYEPDAWNTDDFNVWTSEIDYFAATETQVQNILNRYVNEKKAYPSDEESFKKILKENNLDFSKFTDGYGRGVYLTMSLYSRYNDKVKIENTAKYGDKTSQKMTLEPVTQQVAVYKIRSVGEDAKAATSDDFDLAVFSGVVFEQGKTDAKPKAQIPIIAAVGAVGALRGTVTDPTGAVIPNATVTAANIETEEEFSATTNEQGIYIIENLPSGKYKVTATAAGFNNSVLNDVPVRSQAVTEADFSLYVGGTTATVEVVAQGVATLESSSSQISYGSGNGNGIGSGDNAKAGKNVSKNKILIENSTPRLREYFPETLVWNPELITDKGGKAELKFKFADSITTWKLYAIASTKNGKIGVTEKEVTAFQPFFVDLEPPKFLTEGDEIYLPTQIRNYTNAKQKVEVSMEGANWFSFLNSEKQQMEVAPNDSQNAVFGFKAISAIKDGKQKVTAVAADKDSDAIEKAVTVRPNGREIVKTDSKLFNGNASFDINFPANALPKTQKAELKIYPNLLSHVAESVEGLLQRPYGCGEQTISSTYPNLMILKFTKTDAKLRRNAQKYLQRGYERLLGYQVSDGGFSYWGGKDAADIVLTAYALRFLTDAKGSVAVDENVIKRAQDWLINQQKADGSWTKKYYWENSEDASRTKLFTSYAARTLAMVKDSDKAALQKALAYLKARNGEIDEPYAMALFGLASLDAGNVEDARAAAEKLEKTAISEGEAVYWKLETNTPFYGWGTAGRIETTALVVQLLTKIQTKLNETDKTKSEDRRPTTEDLISKGMLFLLKNKDRYGVWYSTQTTVNVLDAFLAALAAEASPESMQNQTIEVFLNEENVQNITVSSDKIEPISLDLSGKLNATANRLEIKSSTNLPVMSQVVAAHYIDWTDAEISNQTANQSRALRLEYKCDKQTAAIMQDVNCAVEAERIGFKGYGMLLAEIGLPPGADVSRESLQAATDADWSLSRYEILPDRIILYMWSKAGGTKFNFKFRPRYAVNAQTPASVVYDYYNPEAQATVAPIKFQVR